MRSDATRHSKCSRPAETLCSLACPSPPPARLHILDAEGRLAIVLVLPLDAVQVGGDGLQRGGGGRQGRTAVQTGGSQLCVVCVLGFTSTYPHETCFMQAADLPFSCCLLELPPGQSPHPDAAATHPIVALVEAVKGRDRSVDAGPAVLGVLEREWKRGRVAERKERVPPRGQSTMRSHWDNETPCRRTWVEKLVNGLSLVHVRCRGGERLVV